MTEKLVAVVTGANKGIGFGVVRALCKQFKGDVILTARDEARGREAVAELEKEGLSPKFYPLDLLSPATADKLAQFLADNYGGLDILVNNAAIAFKVADTTPFPEQAEFSIKTNYYGTLNICDRLFPLLRPGARVVHVSSGSSKMSFNGCNATVQQYCREVKGIDDINKLMEDFIGSAKSNTVEKSGFAKSAYGISKLGLTLSTKFHQACVDPDSKKNILVNACCPGYVATDMSSHKGHKTIDEGAELPVHLALLPKDTKSPRGEFLMNMQIATFC